jgi:hypothetical protein
MFFFAVIAVTLACGAPRETPSVVALLAPTTPTVDSGPLSLAPSSSAATRVSPAASAQPASSADAGADPPPMIVNMGRTTIRYVIGSYEATTAIMKGVRQAYTAAAACSAKNRNARGKVVVQLQLDAGGGVTSVGAVESDLPDRAVVECVLRGFRTASFTDLDGNCAGGVTVTQPFDFPLSPRALPPMPAPAAIFPANQ